MTRSARDAVRGIYVNRRRVRRKEERQPALREGRPITSFDTACVDRLQEKPTTVVHICSWSQPIRLHRLAVAHESHLQLEVHEQ